VRHNRNNSSAIIPEIQNNMSPADDNALLDDWFEAVVRVRYSETDKMGVVYHANYLIWFEIGRTEFCRARGFSYREMEENDNAFLVVV